MTQTQHTPGPWRVLGKDEYADGCPCLDIVTSDGSFSPAYAIADVDDGITPEIEANARLIAAAPEMFEACQYTLGHLLDNPKYQKDDALFSCVSHLVNALHKARGEGK